LLRRNDEAMTRGYVLHSKYKKAIKSNLDSR
jgi:hypothetical protein